LALNQEPTASRLPRWRGFNLLGKYSLHQQHFGPFLEWDFRMISEWGFNFVRFPMDYRLWIRDGDWHKIDSEAFRDLDQAVEWARHYGLHASLNIHRAPGYCINQPKEPKDLWTDPEPQEIFAAHWAFIAKRYKELSNQEMSFDLLNEPDGVDNPAYAKVVKILAEAIRSQAPHRLIIADGTDVGNRPVPELIPLKVAQATRGYQPMEISHYLAPWSPGGGKYPKPAWPMERDGQKLDKEWMRREFIEPWKQLESQGVGVFVGEWGVYNKTPHPVVLNWMKDNLELWKEAGWGWALWNFRGDFGPLNSKREDVAYEDFQGHHLDRKMLKLLQAF
jgi:endoglucanase